ncbi:uncharacterized protein pkdc [Syngnathoides biaculeatus]|uniref:uncharacterized protein pkdc n=1 Tax=Syngnathoides biaculeatus TaxID=300417 RepID=UPI002ADDB18B|nr:uncharacterized protein pkdc [Syngnathoides biaculeatus]XP_061676967.1 uncharacterized protein pkdc [Syngnathoides biaculeatus]
MKPDHRDVVLRACGATSLRVGATIQTLWSGYGEIVRLHLEGCERPSVIVKHVKFPPARAEHAAADPAAERSHLRKVRSYEVETYWYQNYATNPRCRIPACLTACAHGNEMLIVLEDLDVAGYDRRRTSVKDDEMRACLSWLAHFHAHFLGVSPQGLWPIGTYWHLETRPDELEAMGDARLKAAAGALDAALNGCRFHTVVHGDAKLANFCFPGDGRDVAAVDFQYVGGGCGMKDVAYFLSSCLEERECDKKVPGLLDHYFAELKRGVSTQADFAALEEEWREMFAFAWTDFRRFLLGWMPGHRKVDRYSKRLADEVLHKLKL